MFQKVGLVAAVAVPLISMVGASRPTELPADTGRTPLPALEADAAMLAAVNHSELIGGGLGIAMAIRFATRRTSY